MYEKSPFSDLAPNVKIRFSSSANFSSNRLALKALYEGEFKSKENLAKILILKAFKLGASSKHCYNLRARC